MAGKGGARPGAGRKKTAEKKAAEAVQKVVDQRLSELPDITPLEVMMEAMNEAREAGKLKDAAMFANMAAPYVHPKLSSIQTNNTHQVSFPTMVDEFSA